MKALGKGTCNGLSFVVEVAIIFYVDDNIIPTIIHY